MLTSARRSSHDTPPLDPKVCACGETFIPKRANHIHCSTKCRVRSYWTRWEVVKKGGA